MSTRHFCTLSFLLFAFLFTTSAVAQSSGTVVGRVDGEGGALPGVNVVLDGTEHGAATDAEGRFRIEAVAPGRYSLVARFVGYETARQSIEIAPGETTHVHLTLAPASLSMPGIEVTALRPDLQPTTMLEEAALREANPRDAGELMRGMPGLDAVRRGPVGLDPAVRGLRETGVGIYLDGTRSFASCAGRMDSPLTHIDPTAVRSIEVVKGPYALTWGAGNLSAIRVETPGLHDVAPGALHGSLVSGYDANFNAFESGLSLSGRREALAYRFHGAWREGNDYTTGDGTTVPADFRSGDVRGTVGYRLAPGSQLAASASYQRQRDIDYPGRMMNADAFDAYNLSARWTLDRATGLVRGAQVLGYYNTIDHMMDNDGKPTALPDPDRMPPFPTEVRMPSHVDVVGGRAALTMAASAQARLEAGADVYSAFRSATRHIRRRDTGMPMGTSYVWPNARITDAGFFARLERSLGAGWQVAASTRLDLVRADADTANAFFLDNVADDLAAREANLSGAVTLSLTPSAHWSVAAGLGSTVRTADATERYADRLPSTRAQTSAEFVGDPTLAPERNTQADLWLDVGYPRWSVSVNAFARRLDNYITLRATDLPPRMMGGPSTVYQYANGTATFYGGEATATYRLLAPLTARLTGSYLWGRDETLDEPALGVSPLRGDVALRYEPDGRRFFVESTLHLVDEQTRVASTRGETPTDGYATLDLKGGVTLTRAVSVQLGVTNLTDATYVNHLNAKDPYTGWQLAEPGRVFFADLTLAF